MLEMTVLNMRNPQLPLTSNQIYIGRSSSTQGNEHFGNPFTHLTNSKATVVVASREEAVQACKDWLDGTAWKEVEPERRKWILSHLHLLAGKDEVCWCAPLACHGDILEKLAWHSSE